MLPLFQRKFSCLPPFLFSRFPFWVCPSPALCFPAIRRQFFVVLEGMSRWSLWSASLTWASRHWPPLVPVPEALTQAPLFWALGPARRSLPLAQAQVESSPHVPSSSEKRVLSCWLLPHGSFPMAPLGNCSPDGHAGCAASACAILGLAHRKFSEHPGCPGPPVFTSTHWALPLGLVLRCFHGSTVVSPLTLTVGSLNFLRFPSCLLSRTLWAYVPSRG